MPRSRSAAGADPAAPAGASPTRTSMWAVMPSNEAVTVALPGATATRQPSAFTRTTSSSLLLHAGGAWGTAHRPPAPIRTPGCTPLAPGGTGALRRLLGHHGCTRGPTRRPTEAGALRHRSQILGAGRSLRGRLPPRPNVDSALQGIICTPSPGPHMLVVMRHDATPEQIQAVVDTIEDMGYEARPMPGKQRMAIGLVGNDGRVNADRIQALSGILEVIHVSQPYKQVSREWRDEPTIIELPTAPASAAARSSSWPAPARWSRKRRSWASRSGWPRRGPPSCAAAPSSRAPRPTRSRGWARRG
jgi:hypothetical protein